MKKNTDPLCPPPPPPHPRPARLCPRATNNSNGFYPLPYLPRSPTPRDLAPRRGSWSPFPVENDCVAVDHAGRSPVSSTRLLRRLHDRVLPMMLMSLVGVATFTPQRVFWSGELNTA